MKRRVAALFVAPTPRSILPAMAGIASAVVFVVVAFFLGGAVSTRLQKQGCHRAIAYRDDVPIEQKLGSWAYAYPWLAAGYDDVVTITGDASDDGRSEFVDALDDAAVDGCEVDLWFMVLGDDMTSWVSKAKNVPALGLVYDTGGGSLRYAQRWLELGARSFVGHPGGNLAPVFFTFFLPGVVRGVPLDENVAAANAKTKVILDGAGVDDVIWQNTEAFVVGVQH